ncbi:MAG: hypothetical protein AAFU85_12645 [Planctomycetota bacterium]
MPASSKRAGRITLSPLLKGVCVLKRAAGGAETGGDSLPKTDDGMMQNGNARGFDACRSV